MKWRWVVGGVYVGWVVVVIGGVEVDGDEGRLRVGEFWLVSFLRFGGGDDGVREWCVDGEVCWKVYVIKVDVILRDVK